MKKKILSLVLVFVLVFILAVPAFALENTQDLALGISFNGNTADCLIWASGDYLYDSITLHIILTENGSKVASWTDSGSGFIDISHPYSPTISGATYVLIVFPQFNDVHLPSVSITRVCP